MNEPFFSVNIPVYNGEAFVLRALNSLVRQDFEDWEVVVVDDGSQDDTYGVLLRQSIVPAKRFRCISQDNAGPWEARRVAHGMSRGRYIVSLDADDELIGKRALSRMRDVLTRAVCDVLFFNAARNCHTKDRFIDYSGLTHSADGLVKPMHALAVMCESQILNNVCLKAYRRDLWSPEAERSRLLYGEDRLQSFEILQNANNCVLLDEPLYIYYENPYSTTEAGYRSEYLSNIIDVEKRIEDLCQGVAFDRMARDRALVAWLIGSAGKASRGVSNSENKSALYRQAHEALVRMGVTNRIRLKCLRLDWRISYALLIAGRLRALDAWIQFREIAARVAQEVRVC